MDLVNKTGAALILAILILLLSLAPACGDSEPDEVAPTATSTLVADTIGSSTSFVVATDGRIFVAQRTGLVRVVKDGDVFLEPFASLPADTASNEGGLIGITLDPGFPDVPYVYVHYTVATAPPHGRVSRLTADGDVAVPGSETILLELDANPGMTGQHNGGEIKFGRDGNL
jgi:glucose/arabinose dehydrogenase